MSCPITSRWIVTGQDGSVTEKRICKAGITEHFEFVRKHKDKVVEGFLWERRADDVSVELPPVPESFRLVRVHEQMETGSYTC